MRSDERVIAREPTGVPGLDTLLGGGLPRGWAYLVYGEAGTGKTTLGFEFLREGARRGQKVLCLALVQSRAELADMARSHGWSMDGIELVELPEGVREKATRHQTVFVTEEAEVAKVTDTILSILEDRKPDRLLLDSMSELSVLAASSRQQHALVLRLKEFLTSTDSTALIACGNIGDGLYSLKTVLHGVVELQTHAPSYGSHFRRLRITKMRGMHFDGGFHNYRIRTGGLQVFPRTVFQKWPSVSGGEVLRSGQDELDRMLGGGLLSGTTCVIEGTSGAGKTSLANMWVDSAASRGGSPLVCCFEELPDTYLKRCDSLGMQTRRFAEKGLVELWRVPAGAITFGEFAHQVRTRVQAKGPRIVVLDSLTGYAAAMLDREMLDIRLHELLGCLSSAGVLTIMIKSTHGMLSAQQSSIAAGFTGDTVIITRLFEAFGETRRCLAVLKKRYGEHEKSIREFDLGDFGVRIGQPQFEFDHILTGTPSFDGRREQLISRKGPEGSGDAGD